MKLKRMSVVMILSLTSILGCQDSTGLPPKGEQPAYLKYYGVSAQIEVPFEAVVGRSFQISVQTVGGGCIRRGRTDVNVSDQRIVVRPFDVYPDPDAVCTADIRLIDHVVSIQLDAEGSYTVEVIGARAYAGSDGKRRREPLSLERSITVRSQG